MSEPPEDEDDAECEDVGVAFVSLVDILEKGKDVIEQDLPSEWYRVYELCMEYEVLCEFDSNFILLMLKVEYSRIRRSISWLLMSWVLASPGHQQPWSCLCRINRSLSSKGKNFNYLTFHCSLRHQGRGDRDRCDPSERGVSGSTAGSTAGDAASPAWDWLKISPPWISCNNRAYHPPWWPLLVLLSWVLSLCQVTVIHLKIRHPGWNLQVPDL